MVVKTLMSLTVHFLSLVKIIPGGKSTVLDRIGLIIWSAVSVAILVAYLMVSWEKIEFICNTLSVSNLFFLCSSYIIPSLNTIAVLPALYYLVSAYPHIVTESFVPTLQSPWLFLANTVLCFAAALATSLVIPFDESVYYMPVNVTLLIYWHILMIISSLTIGICTAHIKTRMEQKANTILTKVYASEILQEYKDLKVGISPLLFMTFSSKCIIIINLLTFLLSTFKQLEFVILAAYLMMDLFYITTVLDKTYSSFKAMKLKLR